MRVSVLMFGPVRDLVGAERVECELPAGADVEALAGQLSQRYSGLGRGIHALRFAVREAFVGREHVLASGDEVAVIPPVSGG